MILCMLQDHYRAGGGCGGGGGRGCLLGTSSGAHAIGDNDMSRGVALA